jgi:hypothetical protein
MLHGMFQNQQCQHPRKQVGKQPHVVSTLLPPQQLLPRGTTTNVIHLELP